MGGDCAANEVCCGVFKLVGQDQGYQGVSCETTCDPPGFNYMGVIMCTGDPGVCPGGSSCNSSQVLPSGYKFCQP